MATEDTTESRDEPTITQIIEGLDGSGPVVVRCVWSPELVRARAERVPPPEYVHPLRRAADLCAHVTLAILAIALVAAVVLGIGELLAILRTW